MTWIHTDRIKKLEVEDDIKEEILEALEAVPKSDLEKLVERWREAAERLEKQVERGSPTHKLENRNVFNNCAGELETVLEE